MKLTFEDRDWIEKGNLQRIISDLIELEELIYRHIDWDAKKREAKNNPDYDESEYDESFTYYFLTDEALQKALERAKIYKNIRLQLTEYLDEWSGEEQGK